MPVNINSIGNNVEVWVTHCDDLEIEEDTFEKLNSDFNQLISEYELEEDIKNGVEIRTYYDPTIKFVGPTIIITPQDAEKLSNVYIGIYNRTVQFSYDDEKKCIKDLETKNFDGGYNNKIKDLFSDIDSSLKAGQKKGAFSWIKRY